MAEGGASLSSSIERLPARNDRVPPRLALRTIAGIFSTKFLFGNWDQMGKIPRVRRRGIADQRALIATGTRSNRADMTHKITMSRIGT